MGWNSKNNEQVNYSLSWRDYVSEEKIANFEKNVCTKIRELIRAEFEQEFTEEWKAGEIELYTS